MHTGFLTLMPPDPPHMPSRKNALIDSYSVPECRSRVGSLLFAADFSSTGLIARVPFQGTFDQGCIQAQVINCPSKVWGNWRLSK